MSETSKRARAQAMIQDRLSGGERVPVRVIRAEIVKALGGIGEASLIKARRNLGVISEKDYEFQGGWTWHLPEAGPKGQADNDRRS